MAKTKETVVEQVAPVDAISAEVQGQKRTYYRIISHPQGTVQLETTTMIGEEVVNVELSKITYSEIVIDMIKRADYKERYL